MKKIYAKGAVSMMVSGKGFIFTALQNKTEENYVVSYKLHNLEDGTTNLITRNVFLLNKFGNHFQFFEQHLDDYINCKTALLPNMQVFIAYPDGRAMIFNGKDKLRWEGNIKYKGFGPADVVADGNFVWCTYPENNAVIKYNTNSMRQDFRIGGSAAGGLNEPHGIFLNDNKLIVTSSATGEVIGVDLENFYIEQIASFNEPVYQYFKIDSNEIILTESGIYRL